MHPKAEFGHITFGNQSVPTGCADEIAVSEASLHTGTAPSRALPNRLSCSFYGMMEQRLATGFGDREERDVLHEYEDGESRRGRLLEPICRHNLMSGEPDRKQ